MKFLEGLNGCVRTLNVRISGRVRSSDAAHLVLSPRGLKVGRPGGLRVLLGLSPGGRLLLCPPVGPGLLRTPPKAFPSCGHLKSEGAPAVSALVSVKFQKESSSHR